MANGDGFGILQTLQKGVIAINDLVKALTTSFPQQGGTSATATAGAATLPANPVGFLVVTINGVAVKVPYYAS